MTTITSIILTAPNGEATVSYPGDYYVILETLTHLYLDKPHEYQDHVDSAAELITAGRLADWLYSPARRFLQLEVEYV